MKVPHCTPQSLGQRRLGQQEAGIQLQGAIRQLGHLRLPARAPPLRPLITRCPPISALCTPSDFPSLDVGGRRVWQPWACSWCLRTSGLLCFAFNIPFQFTIRSPELFRTPYWTKQHGLRQREEHGFGVHVGLVTSLGRCRPSGLESTSRPLPRLFARSFRTGGRFRMVEG